MTVTPIPYEQGRFFVQSRSRPEVLHIVDLRWQENPRDKTTPGCGCERWMCHDEMCAHIVACVEYERMRLHL